MEQLQRYTTPPQTRCQEIARLTYRKVANQVNGFVAEAGGWEALPPKFEVVGGGWDAAEEKITAALNKNDATATTDACVEYEQRTERYLDGWRRILKGEQPLPAPKPVKQEVSDDWD